MFALTAALALWGFSAAAAQAADPVAYVVSQSAGTIIPVDLTTGVLGTPIPAGSQPDAIAVTPDGETAYVADFGTDTVTPITLATGVAGNPISVGDRPNAIAIAPNGKTAYVVTDNGTVRPLTIATNHLGNPITVPTNSYGIALESNGATAYVTDVVDATLTLLDLPSGRVGTPLPIGNAPAAVALTPDGATAYVADNTDNTIYPVSLPGGALGTPIPVGLQPTGIAISTDGTTAYVSDYGSGDITPVNLTTGTAGTPIPVGSQPRAIALAPVGSVTTDPIPAPIGSGTSKGVSNTPTAGTTSIPPSATVGDQKLTLTLAAPASSTETTATGQVCSAPSSTVSATLKRQTLRHGAKLKLNYVTFALGKEVKRVTHLPTTVHLPLRGLKAGWQTLSVRVFYHETIAGAVSGHKHRSRQLTVTISRKLSAHVRVC